MDMIIEYLADELDKIEHERPRELDCLRKEKSGFATWLNTSAALESFSGMLSVLQEMADERKGGARTMAEVAARYSRHLAELLDENLSLGESGRVMRTTADAYDDIKTYRDLARIVEAHARWVKRLRQWLADELPLDRVSACVDGAWSKAKKSKKTEKPKKAKKTEKSQESDRSKKAKKAKKTKKVKKTK